MNDRDPKPANVPVRTMPPPVLSAEAATGRVVLRLSNAWVPCAGPSIYVRRRASP